MIHGITDGDTEDITVIILITEALTGVATTTATIMASTMVFMPTTAITEKWAAGIIHPGIHRQRSMLQPRAGPQPMHPLTAIVQLLQKGAGPL